MSTIVNWKTDQQAYKYVTNSTPDYSCLVYAVSKNKVNPWTLCRKTVVFHQDVTKISSAEPTASSDIKLPNLVRKYFCVPDRVII